MARPVNLATVVDGRGDPANLDACWDALTERLRDVVAEAGLPADDPSVRGRAAWALARSAPQGSDGTGASGGAPATVPGVRPYFLILDEMNLARVEYYLADLLSAMETDRDRPIVLSAGPAGGAPEPTGWEVAGNAGTPRHAADMDGPGDTEEVAVRLAPNVYIIGTVNIDETTFAFSPKVLDRAFTVAFRDVHLGPGYPPAPQDPGDGALSEEELDLLRRDFTRGGRCAGVDKDLVREAARRYPWIVQALAELNGLLYPHDLHFGYRVVDEILAFVHLGLESPVRDGFEVMNSPAGVPAPAGDLAHAQVASTAEPTEAQAGLQWADGESTGEAAAEAASGRAEETNGGTSPAGAATGQGTPPSAQVTDAEHVAFDWAVAMKLLPRFHGQRQRLEEPLEAVRRWAERYGCRRVAAEVERLLRKLHT
ncbi:MAG: hypothetical protein LOD90_11695, partial [Symbiobacteriaceae bacterium]